MIMKHSSKKKKALLSPPLNPLHRMLEEYRGRDKELLSQYKTSGHILERLCDVSTSIITSELLGEMFFEFLMHETRYDLPGEERMRLIRNTRYDIMTLYELARAAKMLKVKKMIQRSKLKVLK
jgi:hypothetical protein